MTSPAAPNAYDLCYKGLSSEDRDLMATELDAILAKSIEQNKDRLAAEVTKAVEKLHCDLVVNPWVEWVEGNSGQYEFFRALQEQVWKAMLATSPTESSKWTIKELVESWRKKFPEEWAALVGAEAADEIEKLKNDLSFERRCNRGSNF